VSRHATQPSSRELADVTGLARDHVERLLAVELMPRTLDQPLSAEHGSPTTLGEQISDPCAEEGYETVVAKLVAESRRVSLDALDERGRNVVSARFGLDGRRMTLREIAGRLDLSAERVRQIEQQALEELRLEEAAM
jgi:DNA-directed RNA polymerase sigma subunit (sigma70/sigma32)